MHSIVIGGEVTWFQHWEPTKWDGTFAFRINLGMYDNHNYGEIFITSSYPKNLEGSKQVKFYSDYLSKKDNYALVIDANLTEKVKDNKVTHTIKSNINKTKLKMNPRSKDRINIAQLYGKVEPSSVHPWIKVATPYKNPKIKEVQYRYTNVYVPEIATDFTNIIGEYLYIKGRICANDFLNTSNTFVIADTIS